MYANKLVVFLCCLFFYAVVTDCWRMRVRREFSCEHGTYLTEGKKCCLCPKGSKVIRDCTEKEDTTCKLCEDGTYMDHPSSDNNCQSCKICDRKVNMKIKEECSKYSNTVCGCEESYYCDKGDLCRACYNCDICEEHGVKQHCTETNDTVCLDPKEPEVTFNPKTVAAVVIPIGFLLLLGVLGVLLYWRKKQMTTKHEQDKNLEEELPLKDLSCLLSEVADVLGWKTMKRVALRTGMSKTDVEASQMNHKDDVKEQTLDLLEAWNQRQNLNKAYPKLITTLRSLKEKRKADEIQKIVEKTQL